MEEINDLQILKEIVDEYGEFVALNSDRVVYGIRESALPYPKQVLRRAIEKLYSHYSSTFEVKKNPEVRKYLELLELSYECLGYFLPESEIQFKGEPDDTQKEAFDLYMAKLSKQRIYYAREFSKIKKRVSIR